MTKRNLRPEELELWRRVATTVTPYGLKPPTSSQKSQTFMRVPPVSKAVPKIPKDPISENRDRKTRKGKLKIDRTIDLHDLTREKAKERLFQGLVSASNKNCKLILVITGKGVRLNGVLRTNFTSWINDPEISPIIASYAQAHIKHGGSGAWYVFLKR